MARVAQGKVKFGVSILEGSTGQGNGSQTVATPHGSQVEFTLEDGTDDGEIDRVYSGRITLTTTPTSLDLSGSLAGVVTGTVVLAEIVGCRIRNRSAAGNVLVGGGSNQIPKFDTSFKVPVGPRGVIQWHDPSGVTVTAATGDILTLAASAGSVDCEITLWGRSA
jgi:hypothetical protein